MSSLTSVLIGIVGMFSYGIGDFLLKIPSEKIGELKTMFFVFVFSNIINLPIWVYLVFVGFPKFDNVVFLLLFLIAFLDLFAFGNFLAAIRKGELSLVAPIVSSFAVVTVLLSIIFLGEKLTLLQAIAIITITFGIVFTSTDLKKLHHLRTIKGINNAILAFLAWGVLLFLSDIVIDLVTAEHGQIIGAFVPSTYSAFISMFFMLFFIFITKKQKHIFNLKNKKFLGLVLIISLILKIGVIVVNYGFTFGKTSIIAPVSSLSPAITVILAQIFYKEKLVPNQRIGIATILLGLILISL